MSTKIIVADDSQTIQKIVKMTLENEDFILSFANNEKELMDAIAKDQFSLLLLDYSLSDEKSGYQLIKNLRSVQRDLKVLLMFGTFDTVDVEQISQSNIEGHLVKPFDSKELIVKCRELLRASESSLSANVVEEKKDDIEDIDEWVVSPVGASVSPAASLIPIAANLTPKPEVENNLQKEMKDWGMELPPKIKKEKRNEWSIAEKLPKESDLEYPQLQFGDGELGLQEEIKASEVQKTSIKSDEGKIEGKIEGEVERRKSDMNLSFDLIKEDDFKDDLFEESFEDTATINFDKSMIDTPMSDQQKTFLLEDQIGDEIDVDNFWKPDYISAKEVEEEKSNEVEVSKQEEFVQRDNIVKEDILKELSAQVEEMVRNSIDESVKKYSKEIVEKIAWEIIPDLAENLIKKELTKIAEESKKEIP